MHVSSRSVSIFKKPLAVFKGFVARHVDRYQGPSIHRQYQDIHITWELKLTLSIL